VTPGAALDRAAGLLARRIGLRVEGSMRDRVARTLQAEAAARGMSPDAYARRLPEEPEQLQRLIDRITVGETRFFRDPAHFDVLVHHVLPHAEPRVIWSAGCASGQEPWSIAIALEEAGAAGWEVFASDVSAEALQRSREGVYSERELRGLSPQRRAAFMRPSPRGGWEVGPRLRARVHVLAHNLAEQPPPVRPAAVFCRNVLIYLDAEAKERALASLHRCLAPDGWLFVGGAETLLVRSFAPQRIAGTYVYRPRRARREPAAAVPVPPLLEPPAPLPPPPSAADLAATGEGHAAAGRYAEAAAAFREAAHVEPDNPVALLRLGLALERGGDRQAAERAFHAARALLAGIPAGAPWLDGWSPAELGRLLDEKLGR
jgi:chemotaxis protein methyltransferase CheR